MKAFCGNIINRKTGLLTSHAGECVTCAQGLFKDRAGTHNCSTPTPLCAKGYFEYHTHNATHDRRCEPCDEWSHKPLAGNDAACTKCPRGYKSHTDRLSCFANHCSHVDCRYERHDDYAEPYNTTSGKKPVVVRVNHDVNQGSTLPMKEQVCTMGYHCGHGLTSGDMNKCECQPLAPPPDFPTNKLSPFCSNCQAYRPCGANPDGNALNGQSCSEEPDHCHRCESMVELRDRENAKNQAGTALAAHEKRLKVIRSCLDLKKNKAACDAKSACIWYVHPHRANGHFLDRCVAVTTNKDESLEYERSQLVTAYSTILEKHSKAVLAAASERNAKSRALDYDRTKFRDRHSGGKNGAYNDRVAPCHVRSVLGPDRP